jgi:hypothetical protein
MEKLMKIAGQVALVTGANRGIGRACTEELLRRGAARMYAAAVAAPDVTLLINNVGTANAQHLVTGDLARTRDEEVETDPFGTLAMIRAFARRGSRPHRRLHLTPRPQPGLPPMTRAQPERIPTSPRRCSWWWPTTRWSRAAPHLRR